MNKAAPVLLVFLLSGIPATAVVCDLFLCAEPQAAAEPQGCHEHGNQPAGDAISPATRGCTHLSNASPFVAPGLRLAFGVPAAAAPPASTLPLNTPPLVRSTSTRAAPPPLSPPLALRI